MRSTAFAQRPGHVDGGAHDFVTVIYAGTESSAVAIDRRRHANTVAPLPSQGELAQRQSLLVHILGG